MVTDLHRPGQGSYHSLSLEEFACPAQAGQLWQRGAKLTFSAISLCLLFSLLLLELHVAEVHNSAHYFIGAVFLIIAEAQDVHGVLRRDKAV